MFDGNRVGASHQTPSTPSYTAASGEMATAIGTGAVLQLLTVLLMVLLADTAVAEAVLGLFQTPILGVIVLGAGLSVGRYVGMRGFGDGNLAVAAVGAGVSVLTYGVFGGAILTPYAPAAYVPAIAVAGAITVAIAAVAGAYVYSTDADLSHWAKYSTGLFLVGLLGAGVGTFVQPVLLVAFLCFLLGFLADLVYEIYRTSNRERTPLANGFGLYIAFAGVFVHVLQLVLAMLANRG